MSGVNGNKTLILAFYVEVDLLLSDLASDAGFQINRVIITRYKGNSSQQMGKYGRVPVRECILIWSKGVQSHDSFG
jgi:hypothetical protein